MGEKSAKNLIDAIERSKKAGLERLIFAMGIRNVGQKAAKVLAGKYGDIEKLFDANADEIAYVSADGNISFLSAGTGKTLIARADVIRRGKTLIFCEAMLTDENNRNIAKASFTMCRVKQ